MINPLIKAIYIFLISLITIPFFIKKGLSAYNSEKKRVSKIIGLIFSISLFVKTIIYILENFFTPPVKIDNLFVDIILILITFYRIFSFSNIVKKEREKNQSLMFINDLIIFFWVILIYFYFPLLIPFYSLLLSAFWLSGFGIMYLKDQPIKYIGILIVFSIFFAILIIIIWIFL
ncbi:MAG: hypothetical protein ACTSPW_00015 [Promethearchaeota archaeon]